ncbi:MAG: S41 family peptidase [Bacteroidota bacterium]
MLEKLNNQASNNWMNTLLISCSLLLLLVISLSLKPNNLTRTKVISEVEMFRQLLYQHSSYLQLDTLRFDSLFTQFNERIEQQSYNDRHLLRNELDILLTNLGDRHASAYLDEEKKEQQYFLPFNIAPWKGQDVLALREQEPYTYSLLMEDYPLLKEINGKSLKKWTRTLLCQQSSAPEYAKHSEVVEQLYDQIEDLMIYNQESLNENLVVTLTSLDHRKDTTLYLPLKQKGNNWQDRKGDWQENMMNLWDQNYALLFKWLPDKIAYLSIPQMVDRQEDTHYFQWLEQKMKDIQNSKALIIDLRDNFGGTRDIIQFLSPYFIAQNISPWVANVAQIRGNDSVTTDNKEMVTRGLYTYNSTFWDQRDRDAIIRFEEHFQPAIRYDRTKFGQYYYMLLSKKNNPISYYYGKPVYLLINEKTFSAASIFASALRDLELVKLVGTQTDGSSGLSKKYKFKYSGVCVSFSHMLSFQRNGTLFDGYGTSPDIKIERSIKQILGEEDYQLETLLAMINCEI